MTNGQLIRDYLETVWNQGRTEQADRYLAADLAQHNAKLPDGRAAVAGLVDTLRGQFPQLHFELRRIAAEGELVFAHSLATLTPGEPGIAVVDVFRIENGLIVEHWDVSEQVPEATASGRPVI
ncbi:nuclear transport factor 2 family protein [Kitasatospora azatica]|uniref:nuclear transport factor 2 family protein n=1 Tax=Kitasatospora azatica TaxID=58347 RepID=UPI00056C16B2|nr:nuclear transport factor 2 family protein [Kitasatospora azatica]